MWTFLGLGPGNLPNETDISVTVMVEESWVNIQDLGFGEIERDTTRVVWRSQTDYTPGRSEHLAKCDTVPVSV